MLRNFILTAALVIPASAFSETIDYQAVIRAQLTPVSPSEVLEGNLFMDGRQGLIELTLQNKMPPCPEDRMCIQMMPQPETYTLEGAVSTVDHCGIITTKAEIDNRPVDGMFNRIIIRHNQNNTCPTFAPLKQIEVQFEGAWYNRIEGREVVRSEYLASDDVAFINPGNKGGDVVFRGQVNDLSYADKKLTLNLSHSGGCRQHAFDLKWGECKKVKLYNSIIEECEVSILHTQGSDDMCKAFITKKYEIDLSGLAKAYLIKIGGKKVLVH